MISFMLDHSSLIAVLVASAVAFVVCMVLHAMCPFKHWCQEQIQMQCNMNQKGCCDKQCHEHCSMMAHLCCKFCKFAVVFVQAYGIAFILQRLNVINDYVDAISVALFLAIVFVVSHMFMAVVKHKRHCLWFVYKTVHVLIVFSVIAAVLVYMASR